MNKGKEIFSFTAEEIRYVKEIKKTRRINTSQGDFIQNIIRKQVNPRFNMCTSCPGTVRNQFAKIVAWMEAFIGCKIDKFSEKNCEGLLEKGEDRIVQEDKTIEQEKADAKKAREESEKAETKRRKDLQKKADAKQKRATDKRTKERNELKESRQKKIDDENQSLKDNRKKESDEAADANEIYKAAVIVLLVGEHKLLTERKAVEDLGTAAEIIEHVEETTGIVIETDPKSKQKIINEALSINRKIADYARNNKEEVDQIEAKLIADREEATLEAKGLRLDVLKGFEKMKINKLKEELTAQKIEFDAEEKKKEILVDLLMKKYDETVKTASE